MPSKLSYGERIRNYLCVLNMMQIFVVALLFTFNLLLTVSPGSEPNTHFIFQISDVFHESQSNQKEWKKFVRDIAVVDFLIKHYANDCASDVCVNYNAEFEIQLEY